MLLTERAHRIAVTLVVAAVRVDAISLVLAKKTAVPVLTELMFIGACSYIQLHIYQKACLYICI